MIGKRRFIELGRTLSINSCLLSACNTTNAKQKKWFDPTSLISYAVGFRRGLTLLPPCYHKTRPRRLCLGWAMFSLFLSFIAKEKGTLKSPGVLPPALSPIIPPRMCVAAHRRGWRQHVRRTVDSFRWRGRLVSSFSGQCLLHDLYCRTGHLLLVTIAVKVKSVRFGSIFIDKRNLRLTIIE